MDTFLGVFAIALGFVGYAPYFRDIFLGKTKPHAYTWFVWGLLTGIAFVGQMVDGGGAGAWVTGVTAAMCMVIVLFALKWGEKQITISDKVSLVGALVAVGLWYMTDDPLLAVVIITVIDLFGFYPTFRKSFYKPGEETMATYVIGGLKFFIALFALGNYSVVTVLYPLSLVVSNWVFVVMIAIRRKQLAETKNPQSSLD